MKLVLFSMPFSSIAVLNINLLSRFRCNNYILQLIKNTTIKKIMNTTISQEIKIGVKLTTGNNITGCKPHFVSDGNYLDITIGMQFLTT